jgi:glycerol-3-phosphate O-acyltransferase
MLSKEQVKAAIFNNQLPIKTIKPFKKLDWTVSFCITKTSFPNTLEETVKLISSALVLNKSQLEKENLLKSTSCFVINIFFEKYIRFYSEWAKSLNELVEGIVKNDNQSKFAWEVSKRIGVDKTLHTSEYNDAQLLWIFYNSVEEEKNKYIDRSNLIKNIFEALKPWLDKDLYLQMQEQEENSHENILFEEQTEEYLEESDGDTITMEYK